MSNLIPGERRMDDAVMVDDAVMGEGGMEIYYDGDCPFCTSYVRLLNLRSQVGTVALIDARSNDPRLENIRAAGLKLDNGMAVRHGGKIYHGADAVWILATLSERGGVRRSCLNWLLRHPRRARAAYPLMVAGRNFTLRILGRQRLG